ncbi:MAG: hypothetical protein J5U17_02325 [Candidatus Methanoperedens sp.]|nr:hypothetical protein [Candidatus Methanoperedens sp.]MCE8424595.1 hypothetical protein [Candidatus Methanoperedens sp.]MCE8428679.1 hypothetical protein [Candidatus Methanoperedens sp.]
MSIRIIMCFFFLCLFLPFTYAGTNETVWAAKSSGFIKSSDTISFENYVIKSKILDDTRAQISIMRDQNMLDTAVFNVGELKKYDTIGVTLLGIKGNYSWISLSKLENKDVWQPLEKTRLKWGDIYSIYNYTISIDAFANESINLTISNKTIKKTIVISKDDYSDFEDLRIVVRGINRTGFIELELFTNIFPGIKAEMNTDKDEYFPDEKIHVTVNLMGESIQNIIGMSLTSRSQVSIIPEFFSITGERATSFSSQITQLSANTTLRISANIETRDFFNRPSLITISKDLQITPTVAIIKYVPRDIDDENVSVKLYVYNSELKNNSIHVHDTIPAELTWKELDWDIELGARNSTNLTYLLTPQKPLLYLLPPAMASWNGRSSFSKNAEMTMHMPYISMTKTAVNNKNETDVKIIMKNSGDRPAIVNMMDMKPDSSQLISGKLEWSGKLEAGESSSIEYSLKGNLDTHPSASATYRDIRGVIREVRSNSIEPVKSDSTPSQIENKPITEMEPSDIISFMVVSFIAIGGIISAAFIIIYLYSKMKKR